MKYSKDPAKLRESAQYSFGVALGILITLNLTAYGQRPSWGIPLLIAVGVILFIMSMVNFHKAKRLKK